MQLQISNRSELRVTITTDDPIERQICEAYWDWYPERFVEPIAQIARRFGLRVQQVNEIVQRGCVATRTDCKCYRCGQPTVWFRRRYEFEGVVGDIFSTPEEFDYCVECKPIVRQEEQESLAESKIDAMKWAFDGLIHQSLEPIAFDFLVQLASNPSLIKSVHAVNISRKHAVKLLAILDELHLIDWRNRSKLTWEDWEAPVKMLDDLKNMLSNEKSRRRVKSIFNTGRLAVFRKLKSHYPFVFPEVPLCTFIDRLYVEQFCQGDDVNLFMTCRVDFLICDRDGIPITAIELDGGDPHLKEFKRNILSMAGISVTPIKNTRIRDEELP
jgi:hypothetical protein